MFGSRSEGRRLSPDEVFTPRARDINTSMYVQRPLLERKLSEALNGTKYIVVNGESGNGKTWLYKQVLSQQNAVFEVVNLGNATLYGSISKALEAKLGELGYSQVEKRILEVDAAARPLGFGGGV